MQALAASCEELRARTGNPPLVAFHTIEIQWGRRYAVSECPLVLPANWCIIAQNHVKKDIGVNTKYFATPLRNS